MKRVVTVLNIGGRVFPDRCRLSISTMAKKWGADFVEFTEPFIPKVHPFWQKTLAVEELRGYDQILQLDSDVLIRWNAPSPFDVVPDTHVGVVAARQHVIQDGKNARPAAIRLWAKRMGVTPIEDEKHFNAGFMIYSPKHHLQWMREARAIGKANDWDPGMMPEQSVLSLLLVHRRIPTMWLPHKWNMCKCTLMYRPDVTFPAMNAYIYHFNVTDKWKAIDRVWWRHDGAVPRLTVRGCKIAERLPTDIPLKIVEVGTFRGRTSATLLHLLPNAHVYGVDTWHSHTDPSYIASGDLQVPRIEDEWRIIFQECMWRVQEHWSRYHFVQLPSIVAAKAFEPRSLDCVFIDANHSYAGVKQDIEAWHPKVRPGGLLCGHDYGFGGPKGKFQVKKAVDEWSSRTGIPIETDKDLTWFAVIP